jgi:hypothetical protein
MRIRENDLRRSVRRAILAEGRWERYDRNHTAWTYRELVGPENLDRLENEIATIHWADPSTIKNMLSGRLRSPWVSTSAYRWGSGKLVSHKNPNGLWGSTGVIIMGDWLYGSRFDAMTGGRDYSTLAELPLLNLHDLPYDENRPIPPGMERNHGVVTGFSNKVLIRSIADIPSRPTHAAESEVIVGDFRPVGLVSIGRVDDQLKRLHDEYEEMLKSGEIPSDEEIIDGGGRINFSIPEHPSEYDEELEYHDMETYPAKFAKAAAEMVELSRKFHIPLFDENWQEIKDDRE